MPRRHTPPKHIPFKMVNNDANKKRYTSKAAAEKAAADGSLRDPKLELSVYRGLDGGWYLTRRLSSEKHEH